MYLATSTAVERVFSQGRQLLPFTRNALSPSSMQALLCLGSWSRCGIIKFDDMVAALSGTETSGPGVVASRETRSVVSSRGTPSLVSSRETPSLVASVEL